MWTNRFLLSPVKEHSTEEPQAHSVWTENDFDKQAIVSAKAYDYNSTFLHLQHDTGNFNAFKVIRKWKDSVSGKKKSLRQNDQMGWIQVIWDLFCSFDFCDYLQ